MRFHPLRARRYTSLLRALHQEERRKILVYGLSAMLIMGSPLSGIGSVEGIIGCCRWDSRTTRRSTSPAEYRVFLWAADQDPLGINIAFV